MKQQCLVTSHCHKRRRNNKACIDYQTKLGALIFRFTSLFPSPPPTPPPPTPHPPFSLTVTAEWEITFWWYKTERQKACGTARLARQRTQTSWRRAETAAVMTGERRPSLAPQPSAPLGSESNSHIRVHHSISDHQSNPITAQSLPYRVHDDGKTRGVSEGARGRKERLPAQCTAHGGADLLTDHHDRHVSVNHMGPLHISVRTRRTMEAEEHVTDCTDSEGG